MQSNYFKLAILAVIALGFFVFYGCNKNSNGVSNEPNPSTNNAQIISSTVTATAFERKISKVDFLSSFSNYSSQEEYNDLANIIDDTVSYLIVNDNGVFEEYLSVNALDGYTKLSSFGITNTTDATVNVEIISDALVVNGVTMNGFVQFYGFEQITSSIGGRLFCAACYATHDLLGIHILDCLCCLASCGFKCGEAFSIAWTY